MLLFLDPGCLQFPETAGVAELAPTAFGKNLNAKVSERAAIESFNRNLRRVFWWRGVDFEFPSSGIDTCSGDQNCMARLKLGQIDGYETQVMGRYV